MLRVFDCVIWRVVPQPAEWQNFGNQIDTAMIFPLNQIPRQKGRFYWSLIGAAIEANAKMLYVAMFDEMDEGTAIFKVTNTPPTGAHFVTLDGKPSDWYLRLAGEGTKLLRG